MARLFGKCDPKNLMGAEQNAFYFIMKTLPDYVYAGFNLSVYGREADAVLIVPHMGIFVLEIRGTRSLQVRNGVAYQENFDGRLIPFKANQARDMKYQMKRYFREQFGIDPMIYDLECFPNLLLPAEMEDTIRNSGIFDLDHVLWAPDFRDRFTMMSKLFRFADQERDRDSSQSRFFVDITDERAKEIAAHWNGDPMKQPVRPEDPPMIFLSYNSNNEERAKEIKDLLEQRGIFTWRAPEDIELGKHYLPVELAAIEKCTAFVLLLSYASQESNEVRTEVDAALEAGKPILPLIIDPWMKEPNEEYKKKLVKYQWKHFDDTDMTALNAIEKAIREAHDKK